MRGRRDDLEPRFRTGGSCQPSCIRHSRDAVVGGKRNRDADDDLLLGLLLRRGCPTNCISSSEFALVSAMAERMLAVKNHVPTTISGFEAHVALRGAATIVVAILRRLGAH